ncbi:Phosphatase [Streptomyces sp. 2112.3]|nr:histidinol phosphate phosphatase hisN-like protein [Streptomyces sp. 2321.6]SDR43479.1 Phosphatase [Streptomyces sp. KS_16]SEC92082.1 Phosphatase [Streptomyces sp. 2133.1]SEE81126.1 Phosphatase [Streptomyces sp. 2112.3]SNC69390.1 Phosphatase [Streptomyces sp. 2114.4]
MGRVLGTGALRAHLIEARLAGTIATRREKSLARYRLFAARDPRALLGLDPEGDWPVGEVLRLMGRKCGVSVDLAHTSGPDEIDPDRTLAALDRFAERVGEAAGRRAPVLIGTGHPDRLVGFYAALADALSSAGCPVLTPAYGARVDIATRFGVRTCTLDYVRGVAVMRETGVRSAPGTGGVHTHSPLPVRTALAALGGSAGPPPGLVIGDHGWACGAGQLGIEAIGPADADDPALFVGEAEGRVSVAVPLDDGVPSAHYQPLAHYVLNRAYLSR